MILLGKYEEFAPNMGFSSIKDHIQDEPYESKAAVLAYLKKGKIHMVTASRIVDIFTGKSVSTELVYMDDGKYSWSSKIPYYVENYNLRLPKEFEDYVLTKN